MVCALGLASTLLLGGCPNAHSDYPGKSCVAQSDCYEDESCSIPSMATKGTCVPANDSDGGTP